MKEIQTYAMAAGKARVAGEIVWALEVGRFRFRCRPTPVPYTWAVEIRSDRGWEHVNTGADAARLFEILCRSDLVTSELHRKAVG